MAGGVKGTAIASVIEDVNRLVAEGRVDRDSLEARLEAVDLAVLEEKLLPSAWYSLESYGRLSKLLLDVEGGGQLEYLVERGRRAAERLRSLGLYAQLSADRARWGERVGQMIVPVGTTLYRDTQWRFRGEGTGAFVIEVDVPACFPDLCRYQTQGFIEHVARHASGRPVDVTSRRASPTRIEFHGAPRTEGP